MTEIRDSGKRDQFESGMVRDTEDGKIDYTLVRDGPMYRRWAEHMTKGAKKYDRRNWTKARGQEELERATRSALRHFEQWLDGQQDEDHAAAVIFNINQVEYIKDRLRDDERRPRSYPGPFMGVEDYEPKRFPFEPWKPVVAAEDPADWTENARLTRNEEERYIDNAKMVQAWIEGALSTSSPEIYDAFTKAEMDQMRRIRAEQEKAIRDLDLEQE